jgi:hypothetical protein
LKKNILQVFSVVLLTSFYSVFSQEEIKIIKIEKEKIFVKAAFDESEYKVIAFDRYGNPHPDAITSFTIRYKDGKTSYQAPVDGNVFPKNTINFLTKKKKEATKICLENIKAIDKDGHVEDLPSMCDIVIFPDCKKTIKKKK